MPINNGYSDESGAGGYSGGGGGDWIGATIGAAAGLYDSHQNRKTSKENTDKTIAAQKSESELAYQRSVEMWNRQNLYNSPESQMQRFQQAGLNPNLIYGQGNAGNAGTPPQYQPANLQYKYEAPQYGASIASILPTLMAVGTWMQNMRVTDAQLKKMDVDTEKSLVSTDQARQLIAHLSEKNPRILQSMDNTQSLFPYQKQAADYNVNLTRTKLFEMEQDFRNKFGQGLFDDMGSAWAPAGGKYSDIGGLKRLQFLQEHSKSKLLDAKASWSDFNITDPQAIMQMVFQGVMGMAGQTIRLANKPGRAKITHETESRMRGGRQTIRRRTYEK